MSGRSSPANSGYEAESAEPAMRLTVRKDLFPEDRLPKLTDAAGDDASISDELESVSCVKLETDFEQSIDEIANQKQQATSNGGLPPARSRHRKHRQRSRRSREHSSLNGCLPTKSKKKKSSVSESRPHRTSSHSALPSKVKGGKNLNLVSSSECQEDEVSEEQEEEESSEDEVINQCRLKLPIISVPRQSGKPYSHELSQLSSKKSKSKRSLRERRTHAVMPCSGKPRSMLDICSSKSKKKSKKSDNKPTYQSQILGSNTIKIKILKTSVHEVVPPTPMSIVDIGQRKSKKKRAASPVPSESSGEEYHPSQGDAAAAITVAAPKPRHPPTKTKKPNTKRKDKSEKTERSRVSVTGSKDTKPQSPWAQSIPEEILTKIFEDVVTSQGTLPAVVRLGRVCKLWHSVSCKPELWRNVDLASYTTDKCKTDYKLVWLLENRLSRCHTLNTAHWKVSNITWVLACIADYCPELNELSLAGWSRLTADQLYDVFNSLPKLQRIDLSQTSEIGGSGSCLSAGSVARVVENFGERLTHLTLANNKFTALQQILTSIATHCPNLEVLDISGARATSHPASVPLEALQRGCPRMRVFRAANAQLVLASATTSEQMEASGWTQLEELSIAGEAESERVGVGEYRLGDEALARLVRGATRLRLLDVRALQRLSDSGLVRVPAWDLQHLFLGGCNVTRKKSACLDLICEKWSHSLLELDLSWASAARAVDDAVAALADCSQSKLRILNLCGSSVSLEPVKKLLRRCQNIESLNLSSCRALPRGMKRLYAGQELQDLKDSFDPQKAKAKGDDETSDKKDATNTTDPETKSNLEDSVKSDNSESNFKFKAESKAPPTPIFQEPKTPSDLSEHNKQSHPTKTSPDSKSIESLSSKDSNEMLTSPSETKLLSPVVQSKPDSSSTPRSESSKTDSASPHFSPVPKPDSQVQNSPEVPPELVRSNSSWNLGQFKTTATNKSEASPLNRIENHGRLKHSKVTEQCSPTTSQENKLSPEAIPNIKQDMKTPNSWNYGNYSPMPRQDNQFSSQRSPYSAQPSPAQPSPYSAQPSPYSTQPSPYSSQPSPYSAQPSPDTSQIVKQDLQKSSSAWNTGNYSPLTKHPAPFSPHPVTHTSPDPGLSIKSDSIRNNSNKAGQFSPMSRQDRIHKSPYSPRPSVDNVSYSNKKSPGVGGYSPLLRADCQLSSPARAQELYGRPATKLPEPGPGDGAAWSLDRYGQLGAASTATIESLLWGAQAFTEQSTESTPGMLHTPPSQAWGPLPPFDAAVRRPTEPVSDPWSLGQFRVEPPHQVQNTFTEQSINFESLSAHIGHQSHIANYLDENFSETSRVD